MITRKHHGRACRLAVALAVSAAVAAGHGSPAASADSTEPASSGGWTLLDASGDFAQTGSESPAADASSGALINELLTATQGASSDAAIPAASTGLLSSLEAFINGVSPDPSTPGDLVSFSGSSSLFNDLLVAAFDSLEPLEKDLGTNFSAELAPLISSASPPALLDSLYGLTVTESEEDGMPVYDLTPSDPSGDYVVAIHGGAFIDQPSIVNWLAYDQMANETGATIVVPIYPLATDGGTAGTVDPEIASLISSEITAEGAGNVSVYGDSAGGEIALEAVEELAGAHDPVPHSMVLDSPALDLSLSNPNIAFINDPILGNAGILQDDELWAGGQSLTDPAVSPLYGLVDGLPPTYVYAGSDDLLAPDVLSLEQDAIADDLPFSFILRNGELHDWALQPFGDGGQVQDQIYQELGLTDASSSATTGNPDLLDALANSLQNLSTELSSETFSSGSILGDLSTDLANGLAAMSTEVTGLSSDLSAIVADAMTAF